MAALRILITFGVCLDAVMDIPFGITGAEPLADMEGQVLSAGNLMVLISNNFETELFGMGFALAFQEINRNLYR